VLLFTGKRDILVALAARIGRDLRRPGMLAEATSRAVHRRLRPGKHDRHRRARGRAEARRIAGSVKDFDDLTWIGFFLPAGTPAEVVNRLNGEINRIVELPDVKERLAQNGLTSKRNSPAEFAAFIREEIPKWAKAVKDSGAKAD
jgi:hypothetical protein